MIYLKFSLTYWLIYFFAIKCLKIINFYNVAFTGISTISYVQGWGNCKKLYQKLFQLVTKFIPMVVP